MELDIVFNIDYPTEHGVQPLFLDIRQYIKYLEVNDMDQFERLIAALEEDVECYIWAHPSLNATMVLHGSKSLVETKSIPDLEKLGIDFRKITRSPTATLTGFYDVQRMLDFRKGMTKYKVSDLRKILFKPAEAPATQTAGLRMQQSIKEDIVKTNERLEKLKAFLSESYSGGQKYWFHGIFGLGDDLVNPIFNFPYWQFETANLKRFMHLDLPEVELLETEQLQVDESVRYDRDKQRWMIDFSFYQEVSRRFESQANLNYREKLMIATTLYIIHESIHKVHNLDCNTVKGIGNFPRIIEEADYQADTIAILVELAFFINQNGGLDKVQPAAIASKIAEIIDIAIQTTFSFNPVDELLKNIQVRRVNRYLIWFYHYFRIKEHHTAQIGSADFLLIVLRQFAVKPMIELTGPAIKSNSERDRTFYDFEYIKHREEIAVLKVNNTIVRMAPIAAVSFAEFYEGIQASDFARMAKFLKVLFDNNKAAMQ